MNLEAPAKVFLQLISPPSASFCTHDFQKVGTTTTGMEAVLGRAVPNAKNLQPLVTLVKGWAGKSGKGAIHRPHVNSQESP